MSQEGARFSALEAVAVGTSLLVDLQLQPNGCVIECKGRVCWTQLKENGLHHFGVRFIDLSEEETDQLARFLEETRPEPALAAV
jgi:hypothetical protein